MIPPKFLFAPDTKNPELYIIHTEEPLCVIWIKQTIPAQLLIVSPIFDDDIETEEEYLNDFEPIIREAGEWYKRNVLKAES